MTLMMTGYLAFLACLVEVVTMLHRRVGSMDFLFPEYDCANIPVDRHCKSEMGAAQAECDVCTANSKCGWWPGGNAGAGKCTRKGTLVNCGAHFAESCGECPQGNGYLWCNGECRWEQDTSTCVEESPGWLRSDEL
eukprot:GEMP01065369.1.p1 GENE.GEMP01065369.1~~GEMP01065369.1.p1  ORF type:complete len:136 (+),score=26.19 GEMP01065369.1:361-768(+)